MPPYLCNFCNYSTKYKSDFSKHLKTKKHRGNSEKTFQNEKESAPMTQNDPEMTQNDPEMTQNDPKRPKNDPIRLFFCDFCDKKFTTNAHKRRHEIHRCKGNSELLKALNEKNKQISLLEDEKRDLYKKIDELISKVGNTTYNQNIILNNYGKEDLSHITDALKTSLLKIPYGAIPKLIETIHFNDDKPQNKNIVFPNKKENKLKVYYGDKWVYKNKDELLSDLIDDKYFVLDTHFDKVGDTINSNSKISYEKFRTFYDEKDKILHDKLKEECENVLLNNRKKI